MQTIRQDEWDAPVASLHRRLEAAGRTVSADEVTLAVFGSSTDEAVRGFQQSNGLDADGIVGPATWAALPPDPLIGSAPPPPPEPPSPPEPGGDRDLAHLPVFLIVNKATVLTRTEFERGVAAVEKQCHRDFAGCWGDAEAVLPAYTEAEANALRAAHPDRIEVEVVDQSSIDGAAGHHTVRWEGNDVDPWGEVAANIAGFPWTVILGHEVFEIIADGMINHYALRVSFDANGNAIREFWLLEAADCVQNDWYEVDGVACTNFPTRRWFGETGPRTGPGAERLDWMDLTTQPYEVRGYQIVLNATTWQWEYIFPRAQAAAAGLPERVGVEFDRDPKKRESTCTLPDDPRIQPWMISRLLEAERAFSHGTTVPPSS